MLDRLGLPYTVESPGIDEAPLLGETTQALAERLARAKAEAVASRYPLACVIGSDQVAERDGAALGKPGDHGNAVAQLRAASGRILRFHTAVCLRSIASDISLMHCDLTEAMFRALDDATIERYVLHERPFDCAGSFKSEAMGIALFDFVRSDDPTALIGLPLIALARMLRIAGFSVP
jgi:septum formation protein